MTNKVSVPIKGMHCKACEFLTEEQLSKLPGVKFVSADHSRACAELEYDGLKPSREQLAGALQKAGYDYGQDRTADDQKIQNYYELAWAVLLLLAVYWLVKLTGWDEIININTQSAMSPALILLIGLVAGVSSCMALVGGLVLSVTASYVKANPTMKAGQRVRPQIYFHLGRIGGYTLLGAVLGWGGAWLQWSLTWSAWLMMAAGLLMLVLGLKLSGLEIKHRLFKSAWLKKFFGWLDLRNRADKQYQPLKTILLGAATFFVPCGFTQAMQVYALSAGDAYVGAMTMGLFALATVPGLLGLGLAAALIKGKWSGILFKLTGLMLVAFAWFNLNNAWNLLQANGWTLGKRSIQVSNSSRTLNDSSEQVLKMVQDSRGYSPNKFEVQVGRPVKWVIDSKSANSCAATIVAPKLGLKKQLVSGENIVNFVPEEVGKIIFTCSMGMYRGVIEVVDKAPTVSEASNEPEAKNDSALKSTEETTKDLLILRAKYTLAKDIQPSEFRTQLGRPTKLEVEVLETGQGCMREIMIQSLAEDPIYLQAGKTIEMSFVPKAKGRYLITCAMNIPRGVIIVE